MLKFSGVLALSSIPSFYFYNRFRNQSNFKNSNIFIDSKDIEILKNGKDSINLKGHIVNKDLHSQREKIVIIGNGIIGACSAYYLVKSGKYDVILIDKNEGICEETSHANACSLVLNYADPWVTNNAFNDIYNGIFKEKNPLHFYSSIMKEKNFLQWAINSLWAARKSYFEHSCKINFDLALITLQGIKASLSDISAENIDYSDVRQLLLFDKMESKPEAVIKAHEFMLSTKGLMKYSIHENREEIVKKDSYLNNIEENFKGFAVETNNDLIVNTKKLGNELIEFCKKSKNFKHLTDTNLQTFIINNSSNRVEGIKTNNGIILGNKFVLCSGIGTKHILSNLGISFPMVAAKGHSMTFDVPKGKDKLNSFVHSEEPGIMCSQIGSEYRLGGLVDFQGENKSPIPHRIEELKKEAKRLFNYQDTTPAKIWVGLRPFVSDDTPVISKVNETNLSNIFINTGHGGKGVTLSFGSGRLLYSILDGEKLEGINEEDFSLKRFWLL